MKKNPHIKNKKKKTRNKRTDHIWLTRALASSESSAMREEVFPEFVEVEFGRVMKVVFAI